MITPNEIYLFPYDEHVVWADTDESEDKQGVKYIRADTLLNEIKAQAIEEMMREIPTKSYVGLNEIFHTRKSMIEYAAILRGEK